MAEQERNPSFKPSDEAVTMTFDGPITKRTGDPVTWEDKDNGRTFYLYTFVDAGGQGYTFFAKGHQAKMLEMIPVGGEFTIQSYGRRSSAGKFFGDIKIEFGGAEYLAETYDEGPDTAPSGAVSSGGNGNRKVPPPANGNQQAGGQNGKQAAAASQQRQVSANIDDKGMMAECILDAAKVLFSDQVTRVYNKLGTTPSVEEVMTKASSFFIFRTRDCGMTRPKDDAFLEENLTYGGGEPEPPEPQGEPEEADEGEF